MNTDKEQTLIAAHKAGIAYWRMNRPHGATQAGLESHARSCGWRGEATTAWLAGYYAQRARDTAK